MNKRIIFVIISLLIIAACDPSYKMEFPDLAEEKYNSLSLEEKFEVYKKVSGYIDTPDYVYQGIAKEGEKAIPLILEFIEHPNNNSLKKIDTIYLLGYMHDSYFDLKGTGVEEFLQQKIKEEESSSKSDKHILESYKNILESIQAVKTSQKIVLLAPAFGDNPAIYTDDESIIKYVELVKEKIMQDTGMSLEELNDRFNIIGYVKGNKFVGRFSADNIDSKAVAISFVAKVDWIEVRDYFEFDFLDDEGNEVSLDKIKQEVEVPFYFNVKKLKSRDEIEKIIAKANPELEILPQFQEQSFYGNYDRAVIDSFDKEILINVAGEIDKAKNQCISGTVNLLTGEIKLEDTACLIY